MFTRFIFLLFVVFFVFNSSATSLDFNSMPLISDPTLSPNGKLIVAIYNGGDDTAIVTMPFGSREIVSIASLSKDKFRVENVNWANDERVLVEVSEAWPLKFGGATRRVRVNHIYSISKDGKSSIELKRRKREKTSNPSLDYYRSEPRILSFLPEDEDHILVEVADERDNYYSSVFKVNVNTGKHEKYLPNGKRIYWWGVDRNGQVRFAVGSDKNYRSIDQHFYFREDNDSEWEHIFKRTPFENETFSPFLYEQESHSLLVETDHSLAKNAIWRFDLNTKKFTDLIVEAPGNLDIASPVMWRQGGQTSFVGASYYRDFLEYIYLDKEKSSLYNDIRNLFAKKGLQASIFDSDESRNRFIISVNTDDAPSKYYLYDRKAKSIKFWFSQYPQLEKKQLAKVSRIEFKARDGMALNGYFTAAKNGNKAPLIVFPHGGPHARDYQYFNPWVQMFANSGFNVLQVNFRGSSGFGNLYKTAGYKQWGKVMQQDVIDGMNWVKGNGLADTSRACIVGQSYGGYSALVAGYKTPGLFDCIVSIAGISDIETMLKREAIFGKSRKFNAKYIGDTKSEKEMQDAAENSAINYASSFRAPVLLIHGKSDAVVSYEQSQDMAAALKKAKKEVDLEIIKFGTHYLDDASNREKSMSKVNEFLIKNLQ